MYWCLSVITFIYYHPTQHNTRQDMHYNITSTLTQHNTTRYTGLKEERVMLLEAWRNAERTFGPYGDISQVEVKLPRKIKMRRMATAEV